MEDTQSSGTITDVLNKLNDLQAKLSVVNDTNTELRATIRTQQEHNDKMFKELADANKRISRMTAQDVVSSIKDDKEILSSLREGFQTLENEIKQKEREDFQARVKDMTERLKQTFPRVNG